MQQREKTPFRLLSNDDRLRRELNNRERKIRTWERIGQTPPAEFVDKYNTLVSTLVEKAVFSQQIPMVQGVETPIVNPDNKAS